MACFQHLLVFGLVAFADGLQDENKFMRSASAGADNTSVTQAEAIDYMKQWRPNEDKVSEEFFRINAEFALKSKDLPYAKQVSRQMFLTYVLPYAHFDEPRDDWRPKMYQTLLPFVKDKKTLSEAAEALFPVWSSAFGKQLQFKANMTPQIMAPLTETLSAGYASCTGMSIFLADCLRSVGIPARVVGTNEWKRPEKGNHNWVEVWMGTHWNFVDAVPTDTFVRWNNTWFNALAAQQTSVPKQNAIMSPLWGPDAHSIYNMTWRQPAAFIPAIDVTANYAKPQPQESSWTSMPRSLFMLVLAFGTVGGTGFVYTKAKDRYQWDRLSERMPILMTSVDSAL